MNYLALNAFVENVASFSQHNNYWLIRTQSGGLYSTFLKYNLVGLDHTDVPLRFLKSISNQKNRRAEIKREVLFHQQIRAEQTNTEVNNRTVGLVSSQIDRFYNQVKKGDIVVIPSSNSDFVSFGTIQDDDIAEVSYEDRNGMGTDAFLLKRVTWKKEVSRKELDPFLYRLFTVHQAIANVSSYAQFIERTMRDFFILNNEAHLVINIGTHDDIPATDLFGFGNLILETVDDFIKFYNLENVSSTDLQVSISLNSPGKIDLKSKIKSTTFIAGLTLFLFGGGYEDKAGHSLKTPGVPGWIKMVDDYKTHRFQENMQSQLYQKYKDSLHVQDPEDLIKLLKQFDDNQDRAK